MTRTKWRLVMRVATTYSLLSVVAGVLLAEVAVRPGRAASAGDSTVAPSVLPDGTRVDNVARTTPDGVHLAAWLFTPAKSRDGSVILTHGVTASRWHSRALAELLARHGFVVLAPDARGHGESGGLASYGVIERHDLGGWAEWLEARRGPGCVFGVGASMGAAQLLQAADGTRFCGVVAESSFATFREVAFDRIGRGVGAGDWLGRWPGRLAVESGFVYARLRYGLDLDTASPAAAVRSASARILLIHGTADRNIPLRHAHTIAKANPERIELWTVTGAAHTAAWATAPAEFEARVLSFLGAEPGKPR